MQLSTKNLVEDGPVCQDIRSINATRTGSLPDQFDGYRLGRFRLRQASNPESQFIIYG
jgi:hypothetical protein